MTGSQQIPFDFGTPPASLDNFVVGRNQEVLLHLRRCDFPTMLYLWGAPGTGKSHLLSALSFVHPSLFVTDDVQNLSAEQQHDLFNTFNQAQETGAQLVVAGDRPPRLLPLREDLRTRLGAGLVYELHPLDDEERRLALLTSAHERGIPLSEDFIDYVLTHHARDMRSLMGLLQALDRYSLATQRAITLPLLKNILAT